MALARLALLIVTLSSCRRAEPGIELIAAFSAESRVGRLTATWHDVGSGHVEYRVEVVNQLADPLYIRLGGFTLQRGGTAVGHAADQSACVAPAGATVSPLAGQMTVDGGPADGFEVERFALPLSERGRSFYREYLLQRRPGDTAAIDAEIAAYARAPACS